MLKLSSKSNRRAGREAGRKEMKELIGFQKAFSSYARLYDRFSFLKDFVYLQIGIFFSVLVKGKNDREHQQI